MAKVTGKTVPPVTGKLGPHPSSSVLLLAVKNTSGIKLPSRPSRSFIIARNRFVGKVKRTMNCPPRY